MPKLRKKKKRNVILQVELPEGYDCITPELITNKKNKFTHIKIYLYEKEKNQLR